MGGCYGQVGKMTTFDLWPIPFGWGAWGAGTNMWHPETPASYESLPAPLATQIPTLWIHTSGGRGRGGALILDQYRAFDLFASVDAHLWLWGGGGCTARKIPFMYSFSGNCAFSTFTCLWVIYTSIYPGLVHIFPCIRKGRPILEIYKSHTDIGV